MSAEQKRPSGEAAMAEAALVVVGKPLTELPSQKKQQLPGEEHLMQVR
jgi:hypothetical protein